jgi:hypothetical protein
LQSRRTGFHKRGSADCHFNPHSRLKRYVIGYIGAQFLPVTVADHDAQDGAQESHARDHEGSIRVGPQAQFLGS